MNDRAANQGTTAVWWPVAGRSMWPLAPPLQVRLQPLAQPIAVGSVVAVLALDAHQAPQVVLHRVVAVGQETITVQGDTTGRPDPPVSLTAVVGELATVRLGPMVVPWPTGSTAYADVWRRAGLHWLRLAPQLRLGLRRLLRKVATGKT